jgi:hypothetical protein
MTRTTGLYALAVTTPLSITIGKDNISDHSRQNKGRRTA